MTNTRTVTLQSYNKLSRRSKVSHLVDRTSKVLLGVSRATLDFFEVKSDTGEVALPDSTDVKTFLQESLPPSLELFGEDFFKMPAMPLILLKEIADLYGCGTPDTLFLRNIHLESAEAVSQKINAIVWLSWLTNNSTSFTRSLIDMIKQTMDLKTVYRSTGQPTIEQAHLSNIEDRSNTSSGYGSEAQKQRNQGSDEAATRDQALFAKERSYVVPGLPSPRVSGKPSDFDRSVSNQTGQDHPNDGIHITVPRHGPGNQKVSFGGDSTPRASDEASDIRKAGNIQNSFSKETKFTGDFKQSIQVTFQLFEHYSRQNHLRPDQMANLFMTALDGPARLFFLRNVRMGDTYECIKAMMLQEYNSDARQLQVEGHLQQIRLRNIMTDEGITDMKKGLNFLVNKIEELSPQCHPEFQTERHKINYLCNAVAEFSEWSLGPMENINSQRYTFNRFVTALFESIQAKEKVKMMRGESPGISGQSSVLMSTHIGQYSHNPRHLRREQLYKTKHRSPRTFKEARQMGLCLKCHAKWTPNHRCTQGAIHRNFRDRLKEGESAVHLVSCLVNALESEEFHDDEHPEEDEYASQKNLDEFDSYYVSEQESLSENVENTDMAIATQHISSAVNPLSRNDRKEHFLEGDVVSLNYAAQN